MINYINNSNNDKKFLYITPFLSEVDRIIKSCKAKNFHSPQNFGTKIEGLKQLLSNGENIVSTHSLFSKFDEETIDLTYLNDYILILDEVPDVVSTLEITQYDLDTLMEKYTEVGNDNKLIWTAEEYRGEFEEYKRLCELGCVSLYKQKGATILLWMFPVTVFKAFKEVYLLTYLFDAQVQKYYYDFYDIEYNNLYVKDFEITTTKQEYDLSKYKDLINICEHDKLNKIGDLDGSLSYSWFNRNKGVRNPLMMTMKNNCINYFRHISNTPSKVNLWTTFKEYRKYVRGDGYSMGFEHINMRASNKYIHKESVAYLANRYMNPIIKNFFTGRGVEVNEDLYALSELLQFIFRSQIRVDKPINLYLPSQRMRDVLYDWLD